nr:MAG TPA: hypothetical protein [Caudoviricetes sp.]
MTAISAADFVSRSMIVRSRSSRLLSNSFQPKKKSRPSDTSTRTAKQALIPAYENTHVSAPIIPRNGVEKQDLCVENWSLF